MNSPFILIASVFFFKHCFKRSIIEKLLMRMILNSFRVWFVFLNIILVYVNVSFAYSMLRYAKPLKACLLKCYIVLINV